MKRLASFAVTLLFLVLAASTAAFTAKADAPETCKTPVFLSEFLRGLDYQNELVYAKRDLNCKVKGMKVIFKVSEIVNLSVASPDRLIKEMLKQLSPGDPRRKELKSLLGTDFRANMWDKPPIGILSRRRAGGRQINWLVVSMGAHVTPGKPLPGLIQGIISAYESEKSTTVWTRVQTAGVDIGNSRYVLAHVSLSPYKIVG